MSVLARNRTIAQSLAHTKIEEKIRVAGWIQSLRVQKRIAFIQLSDGSSPDGVQIIHHHHQSDDKSPLSLGTCVVVDGPVKASIGPGQEKEVVREGLRVLGPCNAERYPLQKRARHTLDYLRDHAHLRSRTQSGRRILHIRNALLDGLHRWYQDNDYLQVNTPLITSSDCEGGGQVLKIDAKRSDASRTTLAPTSSERQTNPSAGFFGTEAFLTVSSQLHLETLIAAYPKVYTLSPCFRAEPSQTSRHLAEFWMMEAEQAFVESLDDVMDVVEQSVKAAIARVLERCKAWSIPDTVSASIRHPWRRMTYTDAVEALQKRSTDPDAVSPPAWGEALHSEHERWLSTELARGPVFITHYPEAIKPFYMKCSANAQKGATVECFDLLVPTGELAGGSLRISDYTELERGLEKRGLPKEQYSWYLDLREFGSAPHGGFGLGIDRLVQWVSGTSNVKEVIPFPRWAGHCKF